VAALGAWAHVHGLAHFFAACSLPRVDGEGQYGVLATTGKILGMTPGSNESQRASLCRDPSFRIIVNLRTHY
jgi:hypothetical protein